MVLTIVWMDSPKFFCALLEMLMDVETPLVHTALPVPGYGATTKIPKTGSVPSPTLTAIWMT